VKGRLIAGFFILILLGCATIHTETELRESLRQRAEEYWKLRMEDGYEETYKMESREGLPPFIKYLDTVRVMKRINIISHSIKDTKIEGQRGIAEVEISYLRPPISKPFESILRDEWVLRNGKWLHVLPE